jgi:hypothetical protein
MYFSGQVKSVEEERIAKIDQNVMKYYLFARDGMKKKPGPPDPGSFQNRTHSFEFLSVLNHVFLG